jgi:hypothetical protein
MKINRIKRIIAILCALQFYFLLPGVGFNGFLEPLRVTDNSAQASDNEVEKPDIQWFKQEMKISPKYQEKKEGILGMSWIHFLTMTFLTVFFVGVLAAYYMRSVRTRQIMERLFKEKEDKNGT